MLRYACQQVLDARLYRLLGTLRGNPLFGDIASEVRQILDAYTADSADTCIATGGDKLLSANWEAGWTLSQSNGISCGRFFGGPADDPDHKAGFDLFLLFIEMIALVKESDTPFRQRENIQNLDEALCRFLSWRGCDLETHAAAAVSGGKKKAASGKKGKVGRKPDPAIAKRNKNIIRMFNNGKSHDDVNERYPDVSAENSRQIKREARAQGLLKDSDNDET